MNDIKGNGLVPIIAQALEVMEAKAGHNIPLDKVNLAELGRLTGLSRSKLRTLFFRQRKTEKTKDFSV